DKLRMKSHRLDDLRTNKYNNKAINHLYSLFDNRKVMSQKAGVSSGFFKNEQRPIENGIMLDHNLLISPADKTEWEVTANLNEEQFGKLLDNGLIPEEENYNLGEENSYTYRNKFNWERVFDVMDMVDQQDLEIAYPDNLKEVMKENGYSENLIEEYEKWLPKVATPVTLSDYKEYTLEDAKISAAASDRNLTVLTADSDFTERIGEISDINPKVLSLDQAYWDLKGRYNE
ncbi:MAG: hypothetical protein ABEI78_01845, partial [Candidatus Nanohaloarchaea archaeon]